MASHQLRTPLGIVKWYLEVLQKDEYIKNAPDQIKQYLAVINKDNDRLLMLVRNLLSVSRIDGGQTMNRPEMTNIVRIVENIMEETKSMVARRDNLELQLVLKDSAIPKTLVDPLRFHEAVENLIANACNYTSSLGLISVTIALNKQKDAIDISVKDTGIGISAEDQRHLFEKFFRAENASMIDTQGSGLGLSVVKAYVEDWGGKITVKSKEGRGSTFTITVPVTTKKRV